MLWQCRFCRFVDVVCYFFGGVEPSRDATATMGFGRSLPVRVQPQDARGPAACCLRAQQRVGTGGDVVVGDGSGWSPRQLLLALGSPRRYFLFHASSFFLVCFFLLCCCLFPSALSVSRAETGVVLSSGHGLVCFGLRVGPLSSLHLAGFFRVVVLHGISPLRTDKMIFLTSHCRFDHTAATRPRAF